MVEQFPVLEYDDFIQVIQMLATYDLMLGNFPDAFFSLIEKETGKEVDVGMVINNMCGYAQLELAQLFFTNLIILNETHDVPIDYNLYLIKLFEHRMGVGHAALLQTRGYHITQDEYNLKYYHKLVVFFEYLSNGNLVDLFNQYDQYSLPYDYEYPCFVDEKHIAFYDTIKHRGYNLEEMRDRVNKELELYLKYKDSKE